MIYKDIFFDCDSTLIRVESLDWLAEQQGVGKDVAALTEASMNGEIPLEGVLARKMAMVNPTQALLDTFHRALPELLVPGAQETIATLQTLGKRVWILTSNFHQVVDGIAALCGVPQQQVLAGELFFDEAGNYIGIDESSPLVKGNGKAVMLGRYRHPTDPCVMIGDGSTDLACKGVADMFVGFGGVAARQNVREGADAFVEDVRLTSVLDVILTDEEREQCS